MEPTKDEGKIQETTEVTEKTGQNVSIPKKSWMWTKWHLLHGNRGFLNLEDLSDRELQMSILELLIGIHEELRTMNYDLRLEDRRK